MTDHGDVARNLVSRNYEVKTALRLAHRQPGRGSARHDRRRNQHLLDQAGGGDRQLTVSLGRRYIDSRPQRRLGWHLPRLRAFLSTEGASHA